MRPEVQLRGAQKGKERINYVSAVITKQPSITRTFTGVLISNPACCSQWPFN